VVEDHGDHSGTKGDGDYGKAKSNRDLVSLTASEDGGHF
jgi:hypothetical protein